jgi:RNA polymerase sigma factor (sigma-70 family)
MEDLGLVIRKAAEGDADAFRTIVRRFQDMAVGYAFSILGDFHLAEDAAQEAFLTAYLDLPRLQAPAAFPGWFRRIVFTHCDRLTRGKRREMISLEDAAEVASQGPDPYEDAEAREMNEVVRKAIQDLPEHERRVTALFYISDYSQKEIAAFLEVPLTTVQKRLHDARRRLKERMIDMVKDSFEQHRPSNDDTFAIRLMDIIQATSRGDLERVMGLLDGNPELANADISQKQDEFQMGETGTPLHVAAWCGHTRIAKFLLERGADIDARDKWGRRPLHYALEAGGREVRKFLLENGATVDIHAAAILGDIERLRQLLDAEPSLANDRTTHLSPLGWAAFGQQREEPARVLIEYGADIREVGPLFAAASVNNPPFLRVMFDHGADPNVQQHGRTLLHQAVEMLFADDNAEVVQLLLEKGAQVNALDKDGKTPLDLAIEGPGCPDDPHPSAPAQNEKRFDKLVELLKAHGGKASRDLQEKSEKS